MSIRYKQLDEDRLVNEIQKAYENNGLPEEVTSCACKLFRIINKLDNTRRGMNLRLNMACSVIIYVLLHKCIIDIDFVTNEIIGTPIQRRTLGKRLENIICLLDEHDIIKKSQIYKQ